MWSYIKILSIKLPTNGWRVNSYTPIYAFPNCSYKYNEKSVGLWLTSKFYLSLSLSRTHADTTSKREWDTVRYSLEGYSLPLSFSFCVVSPRTIRDVICSTRFDIEEYLRNHKKVDFRVLTNVLTCYMILYD